MKFDYSKLESRILSFYGSKKKYAEVSKTLCRTSLTHKLNNKVPFDDLEMKEASELLRFEKGVKDIPIYFFTPKV